MECELEANPIPEINWYQASKLILDTGRIRMSKKTTGKDMYLLRLEITNPTKEDGGNYRCNACNIFGESNANISLNFQGIYKPKKYHNNTLVHICIAILPNNSSTTAHVTCNKLMFIIIILVTYILLMCSLSIDINTFFNH